MLRSMLLLPALAAVAAATCPSGWYYYNQYCYGLSSYTATWREAESTCQANGGHLMSVRDQTEQNIITNTLHAADAWIGLNDLEDDGHFEWNDGTAYHYVNWADGQPNDYFDQDCVSVLEDGSGKWDDNHCTYDKKFICKKLY